MKHILPVLPLKKSLIVTSLVIGLFGLSLGLWKVVPAHAATGINSTINFQGKLVDQNGLNVADGTYSVVFTLYDAASSGTNLWTETDSVTTTNGHFQVALGTVNTALASVNFNSDSLYLGIKVGTDAEMTPRIRFTAVPYAFNAQKVAGLTVTNTTGTLTIPNGKTIQFADAFSTTGAFSLNLTTTGATSVTLPTTGTLLTNTATANQTLTSTQTSGTVLGITDSTAITGATTGLAVTLSGSGAQDQTGLSFNLSNATGTNLNDIVGTGNSWKVSKNGALTVASCSGCATGPGGDFLRLANGAFSFINDTADYLFGSNASNSAKFKLSALGTAPTASVSGKTSAAAMIVDNQGAGDLFVASASGLNRFVIKSNGNVGIGTTLPTATLDVAGAASVAGSLTFRNGAASIQTTGNNNLSIGGNTTGNIILNGDGLGTVGIATANPNTIYQLDVNGSAHATGMTTENTLTVYNASSYQSIFDASSGASSINYITDGEFDEGSLTYWAAKGSSTLSVLGTSYSGGASALITTSATANDGIRQTFASTPFAGPISAGTYILSFQARLSTGTGSISTLRAGYNNGADTACTLNSRIVSESGFRRFTCTFTSGSSINSIFIDQGAAGSTQSIELDSVQLLDVSTDYASQSYIGSVRLGGAVVDPALFINNTNSTTAFQIQDTSANNLFVADTANKRIGIGSRYNPLLAALDVRGTDATSPAASVSAQTLGASMVVDQSGTGDIFAASKSGATKFVVKNNGAIQMNNFTTAGGVLYTDGTGTVAQTAQGVSGNCLQSTGSSGAPIWASCVSGNGATTFRLTSGAISPINDTTDFLVGNVASSAAVFSVQGVNGGQGAIGKFQTSANSLPQITTDTKPLTANGYAYIVGGDTTGSTYTANAYFAKINANGDIDKWVRTTSLPVATTLAGTVISNGYIYVTGGLTGSGFSPAGAVTTTYYAKLNSDGSIGAWNTTSSLPAAIFASTMVTANGYVYNMAGANNSTGAPIGTYTYAKVNPDGTLGPWSAATTMTNGLAVLNAGVIVANGYLYMIGGADASVARSDVYFAKIQTDGSLSQFFKTTSINAGSSARANLQVSVANGYVYVIGGSSTTAATGIVTTVYYAKLNADGTVGTWSTSSNSLPVGVGYTGAFTVNGYTYIIGGEGTSGTAVSTIYYASTARVQLSGSLDLIGLSSGQIASASGIGGSIYSGNIYSIGDLSVNGNTQLWDGLSVSGGQNISGGLNLTGGSGTTPVASVSGSTSFASLVVNNSGSGDLATASSAGITRFRMSNNGSTLFQGDILSSVGSVGNNTTGTSETNQSAVTNALGDEGSLVPNAGYESILTANKTTNVASGPIADGWVATATMSAAVTRVATDSAKGTSSVMLKVNASQSTSVSSVCIPLSLKVSGIYNLNFYANASVASLVIRGYVDGFATKAACQANTSPTAFIQGSTTAATTGWKTYGGATAITTTGTNTWGRVRISVGCPASCAATGNTALIDGVRLIETSNAVGVDYAEQYPIDEANAPEPGDVVSIVASGSAAIVKRADQYMDPSAIGVVSTNPGNVLDDNTMGNAKVPVALAGRIPTKVSTKNGAIQVGDYLTASTIPGVAVKAVEAGPVIGQAMESFTASDEAQVGSVMMFVKNTYYNGIPLHYDSGLTLENAQGDLEFLGNLVATSQKIASESGKIVKVSADRLVAGLDVIAPKVTTDTLQVNEIKSVSGKGIGLELSDNGIFSIRNASGEAVVTFDAKGNAYFAGTITAGKFVLNAVSGLDGLVSTVSSQEARLTSIESKIATSSSVTRIITQVATSSATTSTDVNTDNLSVAGLATVSANLRVKGNGLVEGILNVVDTLTVSNLLVNKVADFFASVILHSDLFIQGTAYFNSDTAGYVTIQKGQDKADVKYSKPYKNEPVVNASVVSTKLSDDAFKSFQEDGTCDKDQTKDICEQKLTQDAIAKAMPYVIASHSTDGFTILLSHPATQDLTFSWSALAVFQADDLSLKGGDN